MSMTLEELRKYKPQIEALGAEYGIANFRVFGSVARGDTHEASDIDLMVDLTKPIGLKFFTFQNKLSEILGTDVDILTERSINPRMRPYIEGDIKPI